MFGIGGTELVIIAVLGLLLFGPDKLPDIVRTVSRFMRDFKRYQSMMESTFKAEMAVFDDLAKDDGTKKKPEVKKTSPGLNKKVAAGTSTKAETPAKKVEAAPAVEKSDAKPAAETAATLATAVAGAAAAPQAAPQAAPAEAAPEDKRATAPEDVSAGKPSAQGEEEVG